MGTVAGTETKWLVDSGTGCNVMDYQTYCQVCDRLEPLMLPTSCNLLAANGEHLRVYGEISIPLDAQGKMFKFQAVVADLDGIQGILGANFCYQHEIQLNFRSGLLRIGDDNIQLSSTGETPARCLGPSENSGPLPPTAFLKPPLEYLSPRQSNNSPGEANVGCSPWKIPTSLGYTHIVPLRVSPIPQVYLPQDATDLEIPPGTPNPEAKDIRTLGDPATIQQVTSAHQMISAPLETTSHLPCRVGPSTLDCSQVVAKTQTADIPPDLKSQAISDPTGGYTSRPGPVDSRKDFSTEEPCPDNFSPTEAILNVSDSPKLQAWETEQFKEMLEEATIHLDKTVAEQVRKFLYAHADSFVGPDGKLGRTNLVQHGICTGDARSIKQGLRRQPIAKRKEEEESIFKMLQDDIIEPSDSPWSSPVVLAAKKDGSYRFCVDYRQLNEVTIKDSYPLPNIQDCLDALSGAQFFCTLDLASGYWQLEVDPVDRPKTAFVTHHGLFQFKVLPFGLTNAPATFERLMENIMRGLQWKHCVCFLDDIIVFGRTVEETLANLDLVLQRLQEANLKLKASKCKLFRTQVEFLGYVVSQDGISCDPNKISTVENWPRPQNLTQVRSFLGTAGYYRKFVKDFVTITSPLTALSRKGAEFNWTEDCEAAFATLKQRLTSAPILAYPSPSPGDRYILDTDASDTGLGAVLSQVQGWKELSPTAVKLCLQPRRATVPPTTSF